MSLIQSDKRRWDFLAELINAQKASWFAEIGVSTGRTTGFVLKHCPGVRVLAVDPWKEYPGNKALPGGEDYSTWDFTKVEEAFWGNVGTDKDRVIMERKESVQAAREWQRGAILGVVFIDAAHDYQNCLDDIDAWWPLVRSGGILAGHDYQHKFPGVLRAVADRFCLMDIGLGPDSVWFIRKMPNSAIEEKA